MEWGELAANREELARQAIDTFWHSVAEDPNLRFSAELQELRRGLLARPMEFYRTLAESHALAANHSPRSLAGFVDARLEWSKLQIECGDWSTARENVEQVLERINGHLEQTSDTEGQWLYRQALALTSLIHIHSQLGDSEAASKARESFTSLSTQLARQAEIPPQLEVILAEQEMQSASRLAMQNDLPRALELVARARQRAKKLRERFPDDRSYAVLQEELLNDAALIALRSGDLPRAQTQLQELLDQLESFTANESEQSSATESPQTTTLEGYNRRFMQAAALFNRAVVAQRQGDLDRALQSHQQALQQRLQLSERLPFANELLRTVAHSHQAVAELHFYRNEFESGMDHYRRLVEVNRRLFRQQPTHVPTQMELVATLHQLGHFELSAGDRTAALGLFEEASPLAVEIMKTKPAAPQWQRHQVELAVHLGTLHFEAQRWNQAQDYFEQAWEGQQQYATIANSTPQDRGIVRMMLQSLIEIADRFEQKEKAERLRQVLQSFDSN
ncbi:MAG: hypothetical protein ACKOU6_13945 [Planctomycetota bacterium]